MEMENKYNGLLSAVTLACLNSSIPVTLTDSLRPFSFRHSDLSREIFRILSNGLLELSQRPHIPELSSDCIMRYRTLRCPCCRERRRRRHAGDSLKFHPVEQADVQKMRIIPVPMPRWIERVFSDRLPYHASHANCQIWYWVLDVFNADERDCLCPGGRYDLSDILIYVEGMSISNRSGKVFRG